MKHIFALFISILLITSSCDNVENPYPPVNANAGDTSTCDTAVFPVITNHIRKVLIEDFTGHTCGNCPKAAAELKYCDSIYAGQIIPVAIHVGYFAEPCPPHALPAGAPAGSFSADYRTTVGDDYNSTFQAGLLGLPQGMINRKNFDATNFTHFVNYPSHGWTNFVGTFISTPPVAEIQIINDFDASTKKVCSSIKTEFLSNMNGNYKLVVLLTQDSIVDWQVDYRYTPDVIQNYTHRHALRDAINSAWGDDIANGAVISGQSTIRKYAYNIPADYKGVPTHAEHMHIVAYIYDAATYEVLQAEEAKVIP
jgi:hypothetical protein